MTIPWKEEFQLCLSQWYNTARRELPWRESREPYRIWVSEVMLQQTQVATVIPYFERFLEQFPDIRALAAADLDRVLKLWEGLGYYARARNLHCAAQIVCREHGGIVPERYEDFRRLPGVGEYIAAAVLSIALDQPYAVVDGNVKRVLARLFLEEAPVNHLRAHKTYRKLADALLNRADPACHNQAMMELGSLICKPRQPDCSRCPLPAFCSAFSARAQDNYPRRLKRAQVPLRKLLCAVIQDRGRYLIVRRPESGLLGGLWEFPTLPRPKTRLSQKEKEHAIAQRTGGVVRVQKKLGSVKHTYSHFQLQMEVLLCSQVDAGEKKDVNEVARWIGAEKFSDYAFHGAMQKVMRLLGE